MFKKITLGLGVVVLGLLFSGCDNEAQIIEPVSLFKGSKKDKSALIVLWDRGGLNMSCDSLFEKNFNLLENQIFSKKSLKDISVDTIHIIAFSDKIEEIVVFN